MNSKIDKIYDLLESDLKIGVEKYDDDIDVLLDNDYLPETFEALTKLAYINYQMSSLYKTQLEIAEKEISRLNAALDSEVNDRLISEIMGKDPAISNKREETLDSLLKNLNNCKIKCARQQIRY